MTRSREIWPTFANFRTLEGIFKHNSGMKMMVYFFYCGQIWGFTIYICFFLEASFGSIGCDFFFFLCFFLVLVVEQVRLGSRRLQWGSWRFSTGTMVQKRVRWRRSFCWSISYCIRIFYLMPLILLYQRPRQRCIIRESAIVWTWCIGGRRF